MEPDHRPRRHELVFVAQFQQRHGGRAALPGSTSDVFFVLKGEGNLTTELGTSFTINSLTFTSDASSPVQINDTPGTNLLTIGVGGITDNGPSTYTINAAVGLGGVETWSSRYRSPRRKAFALCSLPSAL